MGSLKGTVDFAFYSCGSVPSPFVPLAPGDNNFDGRNCPCCVNLSCCQGVSLPAVVIGTVTNKTGTCAAVIPDSIVFVWSPGSISYISTSEPTFFIVCGA